MANWRTADRKTMVRNRGAMWTSLLCCDKICFIQALPVIGMRKTKREGIKMKKEPEFRFARREDVPLILQFIRELAAIAVERGCGRLEWWCLDWNKPSIEFYRSLGAQPMDEWTVYRIAGDTLTSLAGE